MVRIVRVGGCSGFVLVGDELGRTVGVVGIVCGWWGGGGGISGMSGREGSGGDGSGVLEVMWGCVWGRERVEGMVWDCYTQGRKKVLVST
jgi:hypothetical protein